MEDKSTHATLTKLNHIYTTVSLQTGDSLDAAVVAAASDRLTVGMLLLWMLLWVAA